MPKPKLNEDQYIAELNRELTKDEYYHEGMAFVPSPPGTTGRGMTGYSVTGPFHLMGVYARVAHKVAQEFELNV